LKQQFRQLAEQSSKQRDAIDALKWELESSMMSVVLSWKTWSLNMTPNKFF
jgi:hypothetical protein